VIPICTAVNTQDNPHAAFDGEKYLVVWGDTRTAGWEVYGQFVTPEGTLVDTNFPILPRNGFRNSVSWDGTNYLVVGGEGDAPILGQFVTENGACVGSCFHVSPLDSTAFKSRPAVAWGTTSHLVVWQDHRDRVYGFDIWGNMVPSVTVEEGSSCQISETRLEAWPNPFRRTTAISYQSLAVSKESQPVTLSIYDMSGRLVKCFPFNHLTIQPFNQIAWNGKDNSGKDVAPGIYFCRLTSGDFTAQRKLVRIQ
jgi:hypothetical protein